MKEFTHRYLDDLVARARASPRRRQHDNIHTSYEDPCQRFFNAVGVDSYIRPHRHSIEPRVEMLIAVRGNFALVAFDEGGSVRDVVRFGVSLARRPDTMMAVGVQVDPLEWHTVVSGEDGSVLLEIKAGPYNPDGAKEFAPWAPDESHPGAVSYLKSLRYKAFGG